MLEPACADWLPTTVAIASPELCKPLLQLFHGTGAYPKVKSTLESFLKKKNKRKKNTTFDYVLYEIVVNLVSEKGEKIYNSEIWQEIRAKICGHYDEKKPGVYETNEYGTLYRNTLFKTIEGFGAEHDRDHAGRFLHFDLGQLTKAARQFDIDVSIQDKLDNLLASNTTNNVPNLVCFDVTSSQPKNDVNITGNKGANTEIAKKLEENNNKNLRDDVTGTLSIAGRKPTKNESTIYRIGNTDYFGCQGCSIKGTNGLWRNTFATDLKLGIRTKGENNYIVNYKLSKPISDIIIHKRFINVRISQH